MGTTEINKLQCCTWVYTRNCWRNSFEAVCVRKELLEKHVVMTEMNILQYCTLEYNRNCWRNRLETVYVKMIPGVDPEHDSLTVWNDLDSIYSSSAILQYYSIVKFPTHDTIILE